MKCNAEERDNEEGGMMKCNTEPCRKSQKKKKRERLAGHWNPASHTRSSVRHDTKNDVSVQSRY